MFGFVSPLCKREDFALELHFAGGIKLAFLPNLFLCRMFLAKEAVMRTSLFANVIDHSKKNFSV
jgi:hypothetical protein